MGSGNYTVDPVTGEIVDPETGEVMEEHPVYMGWERKAFTPEEKIKRSRTKKICIYAIHDNGLHTYIDSPRSRTAEVARALRLRLLNRRMRISRRDMGLVTLLNMIWWFGKKMGLDARVIETAAMYARKYMEIEEVGEKRRKPVVAASLFLACRSHGIPVSLAEMLELVGVTRRDVWRIVMRMGLELNIKGRILDPRLYLDRIASQVNASNEAVSIAARLIELAKRRGMVTGKHPAPFAGAAIYLASLLMGVRTVSYTHLTLPTN